MAELEDEAYKDSPFHKDNAPAFILLMLMRNYDVNLALLNHFDPDTADKIDEAHRAGRVFGSMPYLTVEEE